MPLATLLSFRPKTQRRLLPDKADIGGRYSQGIGSKSQETRAPGGFPLPGFPLTSRVPGRPGKSILQDEEDQRTLWARKNAQYIVDGLLGATERTPSPLPTSDQVALLREIARRALWHMPNSGDEIRDLARHFDVENLRRRRDDPPGIQGARSKRS
jgi:hypothetical protein